MAAQDRIGARKAQAARAGARKGAGRRGGTAGAHPLDRLITRMKMAQGVLDDLGRYQRMAQAGAPGAAQDALLDKVERQVARLEAEMRRP